MDKVIAAIYGEAAVPLLSPILGKLTDDAKMDLVMDIGAAMNTAIRKVNPDIDGTVVRGIAESAIVRLKEITPTLSDSIDQGFNDAFAASNDGTKCAEESEESH